MWPFRRRGPVPGHGMAPDPARLTPSSDLLEGWGLEDAAEPPPVTDEELEAFLREQDRLWGEPEAEIARLAVGASSDRAPVDILLCPACGVYGEHLLDRDGFPAECRTCGWEGGAV